MSHILHPDNQTLIRRIMYAKWCANWQTYIYPNRYQQGKEKCELIQIEILSNRWNFTGVPLNYR